ncbi:MAG: heparinase II/III family protein [Verrucomicrobiales bacterium]|jgi:hypothetical protein|nr:heparinase II/III family protein [Verrucomicrobiales bacterium]
MRILLALLITTVLLHANDDILNNLKPEHPRLIISGDTWQKIQQQRRNDPLLDGLLKLMQRNAESLLTKPPVEYKLEGRRLLGVSREALYRTLTLSAAYRLTGDPRFAKRAIGEMEQIASFNDWHPAHFLDVAEMTTAMAFGYDWLYDQLSQEQRAAIRQAIVAKGLQAGQDPKNSGWKRMTNNWNQVCWGSMTLGALAVANDEPELARQILAEAKTSIHHGLEAYLPEGVYPEGPGYWGYGTSYQVLMIAALQSALGTDCGLADSPGLRQSAEWQTRETSPLGKYFNFSDCGEGAAFEPALFWFATHYNENGFLFPQKHLLEKILAANRENKNRMLPLAAVWWRTPGQIPGFSATANGQGRNPIAVFRSSWDDPKALYLAIKAGSPSASHGHMDVGSFVFELNGVRWAKDLGMQDYNSLESKGVDLWGKGRWQVFRINNFSHNTLTINGQLHNVQGKASVTEFNEQSATVDLSDIFKNQAGQVQRYFKILGNQGIQIDDQLSGLKARDQVTWQMATTAKVSISDTDHEALLQQDGQTLHVKFTVNGGSAKISANPATGPHDFDVANPGVTLLALTVSATSSNVTINSSLLGK